MVQDVSHRKISDDLRTIQSSPTRGVDYIYRKIDESGEPTNRYPIDRNFEPREFESLYQEVGNVVELIFKEGVNWRSFSFALQKLQIEDEGLGLELKGVEKRGDLWVVKVTHNESASRQEVEQHLYKNVRRNEDSTCCQRATN